MPKAPGPGRKACLYPGFLAGYSGVRCRFYKRQNIAYAARRRISEQTLQLYGEYGVSYHTTVWCSVPWRIMRSGEPVLTPQPVTEAGRISGLGNASLAVRQSYFKWGLCLAGRLRVDLPAGRYDDATGLRTGYDAVSILPRSARAKDTRTDTGLPTAGTDFGPIATTTF